MPGAEFADAGLVLETGHLAEHPFFAVFTGSRCGRLSRDRGTTISQSCADLFLSGQEKTKSRMALWCDPECVTTLDLRAAVPRRVARSIFRRIQFVTLCESTPNALASDHAE